MIRLVYNLLWPIGLLFFLPRYLVKMFRRGNYRENFGQRLGWYDVELRSRLAEQRSTWLHADEIEKSKSRRDEETKKAKPFFRSGR